MSWFLAEYACRRCGERIESLEPRSAIPPTLPHATCGGVAERAISAPKVRTVWAEPVSRAKSDERPGPATFDTRAIADGMPVAEWRKRRKKLWRDRSYAQFRREIG